MESGRFRGWKGEAVFSESTQSKGMLEVYLEVSWARLFLFNLSFITVTARLIFNKIFFLKKQTNFFGGGFTEYYHGKET